MPTNQAMIDSALELAERGWSILPVKPMGKHPLCEHGVKDASADKGVILGWFNKWPSMNIGIACGTQSGVIVLDVDGEAGAKELKRLEVELGPLPPTVTAKTGKGSHLFFRCPSPAPGNRVRFSDGLDIRSSGGYVVAAPSVHENGTVYAWAKGCDLFETEVAPLPAAWLAVIAKDGVTKVEPKREPRPWEKRQTTAAPLKNSSPVLTNAVTDRARAYLMECEPAFQGNGGHNALLWATRAMVKGFMLDDSTALALLWDEYNPRCVPPWDRSSPADVKDFERKVTEARTTACMKQEGWLLDEYGLSRSSAADLEAGAQIAAALLASEAAKAGEPEQEDETEDVSAGENDLPDEMFSPPGFISEFVRYTIDHAPYPNLPCAFAAALSTLSLLVGRKFRTAQGVCPNLFVAVLAESGAGKEFPRSVIDRLSVEAGFSHMIGNRFASGESIEDVLADVPAFLFKVDEIDTLLRPLATTGNALQEIISSTLLSLYGEAGGVHICRTKAGQSVGDRRVIRSPHLVLFGTAIPASFYGALEERVVTSGLLSRFLVFDVKRQRTGRDPVDSGLPESLIDTARRLASFWPTGDGKAGDIATAQAPVPVVVGRTRDADDCLKAFRCECDAKAQRAVDIGDGVLNAVAVRSYEKACKLALIYAISENSDNPEIGFAAARWAVRMERYCSSKLLAMYGRYGASSDFEKDCRRIESVMENSKDKCANRSYLMKKTKFPVKRFDEVVRTLLERGTVEAETKGTKGRTALVYRLKTASR